jgi:hypothetical protein
MAGLSRGMPAGLDAQRIGRDRHIEASRPRQAQQDRPASPGVPADRGRKRRHTCLGDAGDEASVAYVADKLRDKGFLVTIQDFPFDFFQELAPPKLEQVSPTAKAYQETVDFFTMTYSGSGT